MEIKFVELKQRHIEAFTIELPDAEKTKIAVYYGAIVRAAVKAGWLVEPKIDSVDEMVPGEVRKLAEAILHEYTSVMDISPS